MAKCKKKMAVKIKRFTVFQLNSLLLYHVSRDMTKPTKWVCAQQRLRSAWASAQSDQSLRCPHEESFDPELPIKRTAKSLIRLGGCPGWSESLLGAQSLCWFCHVAAHVYILIIPNNTIFTNNVHNAPVICNPAPTEPGSSGDIDFSLCKARVYGQHCRDIFAKIPAQIPAGKCEITLAGMRMESKTLLFHGTAGTILRPKHCTLAPLCPCNPWPHRGRGYKWQVHKKIVPGVFQVKHYPEKLWVQKNNNHRGIKIKKVDGNVIGVD